MDMGYFIRFFLLTMLIILLGDFVSAQLVPCGLQLASTNSNFSRSSGAVGVSILVEEIRPVSSVEHLPISLANHLFDELTHIPSSEQPRKNFFYAYFNFSRNYLSNAFNRSIVKFIISYEITEGSRRISDQQIRQYIDGEGSLEINVAGLFKKVPNNYGIDTALGIGVKFKDAYYKAGLNKYKLVICISEGGNPSKMGTLTIEPIDVSVKLNRGSNGCSNRILMTAVRTSTTTKADLNIFYSGTGKDDLDGAPQLVNMSNLASNRVDIALKKIYARNPKNLQILAHAQGYTPSWHELSIPAADGLILSAGELKCDPETGVKHIPMTINIPECHVNNLYHTPIWLIYSGRGQVDLDDPPTLVRMPRGQRQCQFNIPLKSGVRCAKHLRVSATSKEYRNIAFLSIILPESNELQLRATHHAKQKYVREHISVLLKTVTCSTSRASNTTIGLIYGGAGAAYLINPPSTIDLSGGSEIISIYLDEQRSLCNEKLKISAVLDGSETVSQIIMLDSSGSKTLILSPVN
jgi:hypothetical protein